MTEDQVRKWQAKRDEAKKIEDPVAREKALDIVYDLKDDMQLDCQRKLADRIKYLVQSDGQQRGEINEIKSTINTLTNDFSRCEQEREEDHKTVQDLREHKLRAHGALLTLKWLGYIAAAGGGSFVTWLLTAVNKAGGVQ